MAVATDSVQFEPIQAVLPDTLKNTTQTTITESKEPKLRCINDLILQKAQTIPDRPLIAYPASTFGADDFKEHTARELDLYADEVAKHLTKQGLRPTHTSSDKADVVALIGISTIDYVISILALTRMGFSVLFLSTRLPVNAYIALLKETDCTRVLYHPGSLDTVESIQKDYELQAIRMADESIWSQGLNSATRFQRQTNIINEENSIAFIVHSSGSTGFPKPIFQTQKSCLANYSNGVGMRAFVTIPLFHNHGICMTFRSIYKGKRAVIINAKLPLANAHLVAAMRAIEYDSFHCVPYTLKLLAETEEGISELAKAKIVLFGGSSCPDELGDLLASKGVNLVSHYGATEIGQLMTSERDHTVDLDWNYLRVKLDVKDHLLFNELAPGVYESIVLDGLPTKTMSNSDDPPNSFHTRDTFTKHPAREGLWKYLGRLDDRITLFNGEKVLPIPFEHTVRQSDLVHDCVQFGLGRAFPGLMIFPNAATTEGYTPDALLDTLWPLIQTANQKAEQFGRVSREMVKIMPADVIYPRTDKGTIIRAACYKQFEKEIDQVYESFESCAGVERKNLEFPELKQYLVNLFESITGNTLADDVDFFAAGIDSLQSITARATIVRELDLGGKTPGQNVIFDYPNLAKLTGYLDSLRSGSEFVQESEEEAMKRLVAKYSDFKNFQAGTTLPVGEVVVLTGATGSLGAYILHQLISLPHIKHVYCLVRAASFDSAQQRVLDSLKARGLSPHYTDAHQRILANLAPSGLNPLHHSSKFTALPADLSREDLGLGPEVFTELSSVVTSVVHSAWAVNFTIPVGSFEAQHIAGLHNLLNLCLSVPFSKPARLRFISSISAGAGTPSPGRVAEALVADPSHAQHMGYARSKWVAEHIVYNAAKHTGMDARVLRSGQIVGDSVKGRWNATEAIPLMIRSAETIGALPALDENPSWLPVDASAKSILELSGLLDVGSQISTYFQVQDDADVVYHVQNRLTASWNDEILPALAMAGLKFQVVSQREWVQRLRDGEQDPVKNPTVKLLDFFAEKYDNDKPGRSGLIYETQRSEAKSNTIAAGVDLLRSGLIKKYVDSWKKYDWV